MCTNLKCISFKGHPINLGKHTYMQWIHLDPALDAKMTLWSCIFYGQHHELVMRKKVILYVLASCVIYSLICNRPCIDSWFIVLLDVHSVYNILHSSGSKKEAKSTSSRYCTNIYVMLTNSYELIDWIYTFNGQW